MSVGLQNPILNNVQPTRPLPWHQGVGPSSNLSSCIINSSKDEFVKNTDNSPKTEENKGFFQNNWGKFLAGGAVLVGGALFAVKMFKKPASAVGKAEEIVDESTLKLRNEVTEIYNNIFDDVTKGLKDYNFELPKPKLSFVNKEKDLGSYNPRENTMNVNLDAIKGQFIARNKDGELLSSHVKGKDGIYKITFYSKYQIKEVEKLGGTIEPVSDDIVKARSAEILAHETRHYIQNIMMLNDESMGPDFIAKMYGKSFFDEAGNLKDSTVKINLSNLSEADLIKMVKSSTKFLKNYKSVTGLKGVISINPKTDNPDHLYTSLHFKQGLERYLTTGGSKNMSNLEYLANPMEIDANLYAADFVKNKVGSLVPNCPVDVIDMIAKESHSTGIYGHKNTSKFKFTPIVNKKDIGKYHNIVAVNRS